MYGEQSSFGKEQIDRLLDRIAALEAANAELARQLAAAGSGLLLDTTTVASFCALS
jgi:hypothetical protein